MSGEKSKNGTKEALIKSQSNYTGNSHFDYVDITIITDGDFYKEGDKDRVHPSMAYILQNKGLIAEGWEKDIKKRTGAEPLLTDVQVEQVNNSEVDLDGNKIKS